MVVFVFCCGSDSVRGGAGGVEGVIDSMLGYSKLVDLQEQESYINSLQPQSHDQEREYAEKQQKIHDKIVEIGTPLPLLMKRC